MAFAAVASLSFSTADAQDTIAAENAPGTIIVEGMPETEEERVEVLTRSISRRPRVDKPVSKRYDQLCVGVIGISAEFGAALIDRMSENARSFGIGVANTGCQVNTLVAFVNDSRSEVERLRADRHWLFSQLKDYEYKRVLRGNGAAQAWHVTEEKDVDGKAFLTIDIDGAQVRTNDPFVASNIAEQIRVDIIGSVVLIDKGRVEGKTIRQLADYASVRSFASVDDVSGATAIWPPTILSLFHEEAGDVAGLTDFDRAYLEALYSLPRNAKGSAIHDATWTRYRKLTSNEDG